VDTAGEIEGLVWAGLSRKVPAARIPRGLPCTLTSGATDIRALRSAHNAACTLKMTLPNLRGNLLQLRTNCPECARLNSELERRERAHASARFLLSTVLESNIDTFNLVNAAARDARLDCEMARLELENHRRAHVKAN
jgi:hypothetical protein